MNFKKAYAVIALFVSVQTQANELYSCQTRDGSLTVRLILDDKVRTIEREGEVCNGAIDDSDEWECYTDRFKEQSRTATVYIMDSANQNPIALTVRRYLRYGVSPTQKYSGKTPIWGHIYNEILISSSDYDRDYVIHLIKGKESNILYCK